MYHLDDTDWVPPDVEVGRDDVLVEWDDLPVAGAFKTVRYRDDGQCGYASDEDRCSQVHIHSVHQVGADRMHCNRVQFETLS